MRVSSSAHLDEVLLVYRQHVRLVRRQECRAHPDTLGPQRQRRCKPSPVADTARDDDRRRRDSVDHLRREGEAAYASGVAARLVALRDDDVGAAVLYAFRRLHVSHEPQHHNVRSVQ